MKILSIQSAVAFGYVGNSAAVFPLQRLGHTVWPVHTVNFSNHTGYPHVRGPIIPASDVRDVIEGMDLNGALNDVDVVLSGYQGSAEISSVILDTVARVRELNPRMTYVADPVMGNLDHGIYVAEDIVPLMRDRVIREAEIITPNQFELGVLTGAPVRTYAQTLDAVDTVRSWGPEVVLVTSVFQQEATDSTVDLMVVDSSGAWVVSTPMLSGKITGSGDVTAALFTSHYLESSDAKTALERTTSSIFELISRTRQTDSPELLLVECQDILVTPPTHFEATRLR